LIFFLWVDALKRVLLADSFHYEFIDLLAVGTHYPQLTALQLLENQLVESDDKVRTNQTQFTRIQHYEHTCGSVHWQAPIPNAVSFVMTTDAENGTAGSVEFTVEIGQELTGHGMMLVSRLPPQHGFSDHAYRTPVMLQEIVQLTQYWPGPGGGHPSRQPIGIATGAVATTCDHPITRDPLTHSPNLHCSLTGSLCVFPTFHEIVAGIQMVPLSCTSSGETVRPVW
jgi:hypothetical protein